MIIYRGYTPLGTFGEWRDSDGNFICYSLEREWADNKPFFSCVPENIYTLVDFNGKKYKNTYALVGPGVGVYEGDAERYACVIHLENWPLRLEGCIAPASELGVLGRTWAGIDSGKARKKLFEYMQDTGDRELIVTHKTGI